jgi:DNA-binding response OmpR family regulator
MSQMHQRKKAVARVILLVEDDPALRERMLRVLDEEGFQVVTAVDYHSAVEQLRKLTPALICVDLVLPRESGYELCEYIRAQRELIAVPVVVMSERSSPEDIAYAENAGANAYLKKPFTRARLVKYVTTLLDGKYGSRPSFRRLRLS